MTRRLWLSLCLLAFAPAMIEARLQLPEPDIVKVSRPDVLTRTYEATRDVVSTYTNAAGDVIGYTYDENGNLKTLTYPGGKVVTYTYDSNDRLQNVTDWAGRTTVMGYDLSGRLTSVQRPNGTLRRMAYDAAGQMVSFTELSPDGTLISYQGWRYDAGGRPSQRLRSPGAAAFTSPAYSASYHADNRMNQITPGGGAATTVVSDLDGNITGIPLWEPGQTWAPTTMSWDARNRMTGINTATATVGYTYDAEGHLIARTQNAATTRYTVNPNAALSQQLIEHRPDGTKTFYVYGLGLLYEESFSSGGTSQGTRNYHYDQVGSTIALSDGTGAVTGRLEYTAYGVTSHTSGVVDTKFRYNGVYGVQTDLSTGLLQMRARWYSPSLGRFLSEDPAGFSGGMNWYAYADGNPISRTDPFGLCSGPVSEGWGGYPSHEVFGFNRTYSGLRISDQSSAPSWYPSADSSWRESVSAMHDSAAPKYDFVNDRTSFDYSYYGASPALQDAGPTPFDFAGPLIRSFGSSILRGGVRTESKMITVLGSGRDVAAYAKKPGFNVLNMDSIHPTEWARTNAEWLNSSLRRGDDIWLVTDPAKHTQLMQQLGKQSHYLDLELPMLEEFGASAISKFAR